MTAERPKPLLNHVIAAITGCFTNTTQWRGLEERAIAISMNQFEARIMAPTPRQRLRSVRLRNFVVEPELLS
jgi:hypothetical protein